MWSLNSKRLRLLPINQSITLVLYGLFLGLLFISLPLTRPYLIKQSLPKTHRANSTKSLQISNGQIITIAGNGTRGFSGDGGPALQAQLFSPSGVAVDSMDNIFIADLNNFRIRKVIPITDSVTTFDNFIIADPLQPLIAPGTITTVAGSGGINFFGDNDLATKAGLPFPTNIALDTNGNIFIADGSGRIRRVDAPSGIITTSAGNGSFIFSGDNGLAVLAGMDAQGVAIDSNGNIFVADTLNNRIRRVDAITNNVTTFAGNGLKGASGDTGLATNASLFSPSNIALDLAGNLFIADTANHRIRRVTPNGIITTVAGNGAAGFSGDNGLAVAASLNNPLAITIDRAGNLFIADTFNNRIRRVTPNGIITTVAGDGTPLFGGDGSLATRSGLNGPSGVAIDSTGNLIIVDSRNQAIRLVKGVAASQ